MPEDLIIQFSFEAVTVSEDTISNLGRSKLSTATLSNGASLSSSDFVVGASSVQLVAEGFQFVQLPSYSFGSNGVSFSFWFRSDNSEDGVAVFDFSTVLGMFVNTGSLGFYVSDNFILTNLYVNDNMWRHIGWTIDTDGSWILYVNGIIYWIEYAAGYPDDTLYTSNYLGFSDFGDVACLNGAIDDFRVYDSLLLGVQVANNYNSVADPQLCAQGE